MHTIFKAIFCMVCISVLTSFTDISIYDLSIYTMDDEEYLLSEFKDKEILIIILPTGKSSQDSEYLSALGSVTSSHSDSLVVIGMPAYEYGYKNEQRDSLNQWYRNLLGYHVLLSVGVYVNPSPPELQNNLITWLTSKDQNTHFNFNIKGTGQAFFVNTDGILHLVNMPESNIDELLIQKALHEQIPE